MSEGALHIKGNFNSLWGGDLIVTAKQFVDQIYIPLLEGWGYIYGTSGIVWTAARQKAATRAMWTVTVTRADGREIMRESRGAFPDMTPQPEPEPEEPEQGE